MIEAKPTTRERVQCAIQFAIVSTASWLAIKVTEYNADSGTSVWKHVLSHSWFWFAVCVPMGAVIGATVFADVRAKRRFNRRD
jgi:hypothetical protein